jgi:hypothetical protein
MRVGPVHLPRDQRRRTGALNEPGLFLIDPRGSVYYEAILSMVAGRPRLDDLLGGIYYWVSTGYAARGEA